VHVAGEDQSGGDNGTILQPISRSAPRLNSIETGERNRMKEQKFSWLSFMAAVASVSMIAPLAWGSWFLNAQRAVSEPTCSRANAHVASAQLPADHYLDPLSL
jgi:hypothetical protein